MRIALIGDFDTYLFRGRERPPELGQYRLSPALNLARGFAELRVRDIHFVVTTPEVAVPTIDDGPFGTLHRLPRPRFSGSGSFFLWRRHRLLQELRRIQPDIVHGQGTEAEYGFTAVTSPYPHVLTFHGIMHRVHEVDPPQLLYLQHTARWLEKLVARKVRHVIAISPDVEEFLRERRSSAHCYRIPNAMAPCFFDVQNSPPLPGVFRLLYVGTISPRKGLLYLVEALGQLRADAGPRLSLRIIGSGGGSYRLQVQERARQLGVEQQIEWRGVVNEQGVADALAESDALVLPSFWENMPMCIGEALAAGVPVISTHAAGIPHWVEDGVTGLLVPPGDSTSLAGAIRTLWNDPERRRQMGLTGRAKATAEYLPRVVAEKTLAVYRTIMEKTRK